MKKTVAVHAKRIERFASTEGIRDRSASESALGRTQVGYFSDPMQEATALWESLSQNHPFVDGSKRVRHNGSRTAGRQFSCRSMRLPAGPWESCRGNVHLRVRGPGWPQVNAERTLDGRPAESGRTMAYVLSHAIQIQSRGACSKLSRTGGFGNSEVDLARMFCTTNLSWFEQVGIADATFVPGLQLPRTVTPSAWAAPRSSPSREASGSPRRNASSRYAASYNVRR